MSGPAPNAFKSALWSGVSSYGNVVLSFVIFALLARLLTPDQFGVVAIASVFLDILLLVAGGGLRDVVVQKPELDDATASTAFWVAAGSGTVFTLVMIGLSPLIAMAFHMPELQPTLSALAFCFLISGLGAIHEGRLQRAFDFKKLAMRALASNLLAGVIAIGLAFMGWGVWSLVAQRLTAVLMTTLFNWLAFKWVPALTFDRQLAWDQVKQGATIFGTTLVLALNNRIHELITAIFLSPAAVAFIRMGWRMIDLVSQLAVIPFTSVALPTYARVQDDREALVKAYIGFVRVSACVAFPAFFGMSALAKPLISLLFGNQWDQAAVVLQVLSLIAVPFVTSSFMWPLLVALRKSHLGLNISLMQLTAGAVLSFLAGPLGLMVVAASHTFRSYSLWPVVIALLRSATGVTIKATLQAIWAPFVAAGAMGIAVWALQGLLHGLPAALQVLTSIAIAAPVYVGLLAILSPAMVGEVIAQAGAIIRRRTPAPAGK
jgi:O-antigen/teichoic acid export membrane protein